MRRHFWLRASWVVLVACATGPLVAHDGATGIVKQRMDEMKEMGRALKRIDGQLRSGRATAEIVADAERIRNAAELMTSRFPEGSDGGRSEASPEIWRQWPAFLASAAALAREAETLRGAASAGDPSKLATPVRAVKGQCTACHDRFRIAH